MRVEIQATYDPTELIGEALDDVVDDYDVKLADNVATITVRFDPTDVLTEGAAMSHVGDSRLRPAPAVDSDEAHLQAVRVRRLHLQPGGSQMKARTNTERLHATGIGHDADAEGMGWGEPSTVIDTYLFCLTGALNSKVHLTAPGDDPYGTGSALCGVGIWGGQSQTFNTIIDGGGEHQHPGLCRKCLLALERETANAP